MTNETLFYTQVASIITFVVSLFILYRVLVHQKDATIQLLKEQVNFLKNQVSSLKCEQPDILVKTYTERVEALEKELERLLAERTTHKKKIQILRDEILHAKNKIEIIEPQIKKAFLTVHKYRLGQIERKRILGLYNGKCQVCSHGDSTTTQLCHIKPLFSGGVIDPTNLICLCPNHHILFDQGKFSIADDFTLIGIEGKLERHPQHYIDLKCLKFHRENVYKPNNRIKSDS
jgi:predicted restriction endonuclease